MNILYIAYSCNPYNGSEDKIGWSIPWESAKYNQVHVITREDLRENIEDYLQKHENRNIYFHYVPQQKVFSDLFHVTFYTLKISRWHKDAYVLAKQLCHENAVEIIHQITPVEFRSIGSYGNIPNTKFVCGPIAGGQQCPRVLMSYMGKKRVVEYIRNAANKWYRLKYKVTQKLKGCSFIFFANEETRNFLQDLVDAHKIEWKTVPDVAIDAQEITETTQRGNNADRFHILIVGRLVKLKGHALLLDALSGLPDHYQYECRIVGDGPEMSVLKQKAISYGLEKNVTFAGQIPYTQVQDEYRKADVLILPSFREATGSVLLEAMAKGCPIISINKFGGRIICDEQTGWLYEGNSREDYVAALRQAILSCLQQPQLAAQKGAKAREYAQNHTWENRMAAYQYVYESLSDR